MGLNPLVATSNPATVSLSSGFLSLAVKRSNVASGVTYALESSGDLTNGWSTNSVVIDSNIPTLLQGHDINAVGLTHRRFMRLKVSQP